MFSCIEGIRRDAGTEVPQNLLEFVSSLTEKPVVAQSSAIPPIQKRLKVQRDAFCEEVNCSLEHFPAPE